MTRTKTSFDSSFAPQTIDAYDSSSRLIQRILKPANGETQTTTFTYDSHSNLASQTDPYGNQTLFRYDTSYTGAAITPSVGNLTRRIDPPPSGTNNVVTLYKYDSHNNLIETIPPAGRHERRGGCLYHQPYNRW